MRSKLGGYSLFAAGALAALLAFGPTAPATLAFADDPAAATVKDDAVEPGATETDEGEPSGSAAAKAGADVPSPKDVPNAGTDASAADEAAASTEKADDQEANSNIGKHYILFDVIFIDADGHRVSLPGGPADLGAFIDESKPFVESCGEQLATIEGIASDTAREKGGSYRGLYGLEKIEYNIAGVESHFFGEKIDPSKPVSVEGQIGSDYRVYAVADVPGCEHNLAQYGAKVTNKYARMDVPLYGPEWSLSAEELGMSVTAVFDGANVPEGSSVYMTWSPAGGDMIDGVVKTGIGLRLFVDGKPVGENFGRITFTGPIDESEDAAYSDGKLHDVVVEAIYGENVLKREIIPTTLVKGAKASITVDNMPNGHVMVCIEPGNLAHVATEEIPVAGNTGVKASGTIAGPNVPEGAAVRVEATELKSGDPAYDKLVDAMGGGLLTGVYDISMLVNGSQIHDGFGEITVTIPVDPRYNGQWMTLWHLHNDGTITSQRSIVKDGGITFAVTDLSAFALELEPVSEDNGNTGADDGQNVVPEDKEPSGDSAPEQPAAKPEADRPAAKPEGGDKPAAQDDAAASPKGEVLPQTGDPAALLGFVAASGAALAAFGVSSKRRR